MLQPVGPLPPSVYWRRRVAALAAAVVLLGSLVWGVVTVVGWGGEGTMLADTRPASFAAAEQEQREQARQEQERRDAEQRERQEREQQEREQQPPDPSATPAPPPTPQAPPPPPEDPSTALLGPPTGAARALLPGAVLGTTTPSAPPPAPEPSTAPAPQAAPAPPCPDEALTVTAGSDKPRYAAGERPGFSLVVTNVGDVACTRDLDAARQAVAVVHTPGDGLWSSDDCAAPAAKAPDVRRLAPGETARFSSSWSGRTSLPGCAAPRQIVPPGDYQLLARLDGLVSEPVPFTLSG